MITDLKHFIVFILKSKLLILGFIIYFLFNLSAVTNHFMDLFFFGSSIHHCCQGLDFYQIPNAFHALVNGGDLHGNIPEGIEQYSKNYLSNKNVYHPLLTIILGGFFVNFNPDISFNLWNFIKIFITLISVFYIYRNFQESKYLKFALFIFLINFSQYNEIKLSQYQFLFNISLLYLLINLVKNKNQFEGGALYFITLISKPVSLLFAPVLLIKKKWNLLITGLSLFTISTLTFKFLGLSDYYLDNIIYHLFYSIPTKGIDFMSLDALLRNGFDISQDVIRIMKFTTLIGIYLLAFSKKINIIKLIFLLTIYFLFFYDYVFQYHFSVLGPILSFCVLTLKEFQAKISRLFILIISLPNLFFIFRLLNIGIEHNHVYGINPILNTWIIVSFFQLLPIFILMFIVLVPDIKHVIYYRYKNA